MSGSEIATNLRVVEGRIAAACARAGREPREVTLVAVSKARSGDEIRAAYAAGVRHFGENRVEEAELKILGLQDMARGGGITWHMVGHLQSRKAKRALVFDWVHSVDTIRLAQRLDTLAAETDAWPRILLELNVSGEAAKDGFAAWNDIQVYELTKELQALEALRRVKVYGLMTMAPIVRDPEEARPVFRRLRRIADMFREELLFTSWPELSMGMTDDFEVAIEEGATMVRIGRAVFGPSSY